MIIAPTPALNIQVYTMAGWTVGMFTRRKSDREATNSQNQDAFALAPMGDGFWVAIADGVSSVSRGAEAAQHAVSTFQQVIQSEPTPPGDHERQIRIGRAIAAARDDLISRNTEFVDANPGEKEPYRTTFSALMVTPRHIACQRAGDGFTYIANEKHITALGIGDKSPYSSQIVDLVDEHVTLDYGSMQPLSHTKAFLMGSDGAEDIFTIKQPDGPPIMDGTALQIMLKSVMAGKQTADTVVRRALFDSANPQFTLSDDATFVLGFKNLEVQDEIARNAPQAQPSG